MECAINEWINISHSIQDTPTPNSVGEVKTFVSLTYIYEWYTINEWMNIRFPEILLQ